MAPRGSSKHRPVFHAIVLAIGFVTGGLLQQAARSFFPGGAAKQFLTVGVAPSLGPFDIDLVLVKFQLGIALDVSLLSLVGVLIAYLIARSLF
jgi:uncharacterized protein DUF4321